MLLVLHQFVELIGELLLRRGRGFGGGDSAVEFGDCLGEGLLGALLGLGGLLLLGVLDGVLGVLHLVVGFLHFLFDGVVGLLGLGLLVLLLGVLEAVLEVSLLDL